MKLTEKSIVSTLSLIGSLASYYYGKTHEKDVVPYVMIGGFIGASFQHIGILSLEFHVDKLSRPLL